MLCPIGNSIRQFYLLSIASLLKVVVAVAVENKLIPAAEG